MKKAIILFSLFLLVLPMITSAQNEENKFGVEWHGYVNYEMMYDSRQMVTAREGDVLLFPAAVVLDESGVDINDRSSFNMLTINSRLQAKISGPDAFGAKTSGMISGDFFGTANDKISTLRLRQAFVKLDWEKTQLLVGKTWHPMLVTSCYPLVLTFGAAAPFGTLSRAPQIRLSQKMGDFKLMVAALTQSDFASTGPDGSCSDYQRNANIPEIAGQVAYSKGKFFSAITATYITLQPRVTTTSGYFTDEKISGLNVNALAKYKFEDITVNVSGLYGQNVTNLVMLGGYAVTSISNDEYQYEEYTNISTMALWTDLYTNYKKVNVGLFAGYTANLGAGEETINIAYSRGSNVDYAYRISPRVIFTSGKVNLGFEAIYDGIAYGTPDAEYNIEDAEEVNGFRFMSSIKYVF